MSGTTGCDGKTHVYWRTTEHVLGALQSCQALGMPTAARPACCGSPQTSLQQGRAAETDMSGYQEGGGGKTHDSERTMHLAVGC
jgi:hypothetical protein